MEPIVIHVLQDLSLMEVQRQALYRLDTLHG